MRRTIDGFTIRPRQPYAAPARQALTAPAVAASPMPRTHRTYALPSKPARRGIHTPRWLQITLIIFLALIAGMFAQSAILGQLLVAAYGVFAVASGVPSRATFILALLGIVMSLLTLIFRGDVELAQSFATYTFLLLVAGVVCLGRETKREGGRIYSIRTRN